MNAIYPLQLKNSTLPEIIDAIRAVQRGQNNTSQELTTLLVNRRNRIDERYFEIKKTNDLTTAERRVMKLIARDKTSRQITQELFIS